MAETIKFTLKTLRLPNKNPEILFCNQHMILDKDEIEIPYEVNLGQNNVTIKLLNKTNRDTKVVDGKIIADLAVIVDKIEYRGHNLHSYIETISKYIDDNNQIIQGTHGFMAFNGTLTIRIDGPVFVYLRDLAIQNG